VAWLYREKLLDQNVLAAEEVKTLERSFRERLQEALDTVKSTPLHERSETLGGVWQGFTRSHVCQVETRVRRDLLEAVARRLSAMPEDFTLNPKVEKLVQARTEAVLTN